MVLLDTLAAIRIAIAIDTTQSPLISIFRDPTRCLRADASMDETASSDVIPEKRTNSKGQAFDWTNMA